MLAVHDEEKTLVQCRTYDRSLALCGRLLGPTPRTERVPLPRHRKKLAGDPWPSSGVGILADRPELFGADGIRRARLALHSTSAPLRQDRPGLVHWPCLQL